MGSVEGLNALFHRIYGPAPEAIIREHPHAHHIILWGRRLSDTIITEGEEKATAALQAETEEMLR